MIFLALFIPLLGFLFLMTAADKISRSLTNCVGCSSILISFCCFADLFFTSIPLHATLFKWIPVEGIDANFSLYLDHLSILMALIITGIGFLIHLYATGYSDHEEDFARFFACLNFFVFAMLLLVLADNLLLLFVGWEAVGLASYLLIGFWYSRPKAAEAATKAFIINRIGDFGLLVALLLIFFLFGTSNMATINQRASQMFAVGAPIMTLLTLLLFMGATGKSAQIPLHTWLPDAMEGPTPVSALIHAATMVTAGVYLVVRLHPLFLLSPITMFIIATIGAATALFAALCAMGQTDLKRVLAFSTVSQLGLMFLACGTGAFYAAMFHLTTHAFMKSLLFLSAGNLVHMLHGVTDMGKMGGLAKRFPITNWLFLIGVLAMSGIPPLAAFFSKDLILEEVHQAGFSLLFYVGLFASILTAFYLMRAYLLTFRGSIKLEEKILQQAKEAPPVMILPVSLLALFSILGGFLGFAFEKIPPLQQFLQGITDDRGQPSERHSISLETYLAVGGALAAILVAVLLYTKFANRLRANLPLLRNSFYIDEIYHALFVIPLAALASLIASLAEPKIIEGSLETLVKISKKIASRLQRMQSGEIRSYVAWMVVGAVLLIIRLAL